jgi:phosphate uptake regulator
MFKNLLSFWKEKDFLQGILSEFSDMLHDTKDMFASVCINIVKGEVSESVLEEKIYSLDKRVNEIEKNIRKRVVEHLSIQPGADLPFCLVLMSVVKDAERVGDYAKNLVEVVKFKRGEWSAELYVELFDNLCEHILDMFDKTEKAFIESDRKIAEDLWRIEREIVKKCDKTIEYLAGSDVNTNQAVCFTLMARHCKRIAAHLANIATSVILPISELDFFDEKQRNAKK